MFDHLNSYRCMWVLILFDLPTETKKDRKAAARFRKNILKDGFAMFQFSIYLRHCPSRENAEVHTLRVKNMLPPKGHVGILRITDKQLSNMELFISSKKEIMKNIPQQLEMF